MPASVMGLSFWVIEGRWETKILFNGNQCWAALLRVQAKFAKLQEAGSTAADLETAKATWLKPDLEKKLSQGFPLKVNVFH